MINVRHERCQAIQESRCWGRGGVVRCVELGVFNLVQSSSWELREQGAVCPLFAVGVAVGSLWSNDGHRWAVREGLSALSSIVLSLVELPVPGRTSLY